MENLIEVDSEKLNETRQQVEQEIEKCWKASNPNPEYPTDRSEAGDIGLWEASQARKRTKKIKLYLTHTKHFDYDMPGSDQREN